MKKIIYGLGVTFDRWTVSDSFSLDEVVGLADKNAKLIGKDKFGYIVISPQAILGLNYDKILVSTPKYYTEIKNELMAMGVEEDKIDLLNYIPEKHDSELYYWKKVYERENGKFANEHYKKLFLSIANEDSDYFMQDKVIADFGCGPRGSLAWTDAPKVKIGCDVLINKYMDHFGDCLKKHGMVYVNTDENNIPLPTQYVDILSTINSLDHVDNLDRIISELLRIMKPGAILLGSFNLNEPRTNEEPQTLSINLLKEKLFKYFEVIEEKMALKNPENTYVNLMNGNYVSKLAPDEIGVLWIKARKK